MAGDAPADAAVIDPRHLPRSTLHDVWLDRTRAFAAPGVLVVRKGNTDGVPETQPGEVAIFFSFILAGLMPPFSDFFLATLRFFNIHLAHLVSNSIIQLATFAHLCEQFIGVVPSVTLFRVFYSLRPASTQHVVGSCSFRLRESGHYIPMPMKGKWDSWTRHWVYLQAGATDSHLAWPEEPAEPQDSWGEAVEMTPELETVVARLRRLREGGLTGLMVITDFLRRRISPLRQRERLACYYTGDNDPTRSFPGGESVARLLCSFEFAHT